MENKLELRMYGLVPYNIKPIQQGIQHGHSTDVMALLEINRMLRGEKINPRYYEWLSEWKTYIILNGGTTNTRGDIVTGEPVGTLNQHLLSLIRNRVPHTVFTEEDLGDQLTAVTFIVDERCWDRETYPDFNDVLLPDPYRKLTDEEYRENRYQAWLERIGGKQNEFLREFLPQFKLA